MIAGAWHSSQNLNTESMHLNIKAIERSCVFLTKNTTNVYVRDRKHMHAGKQKQLLSVVKRRKLPGMDM
jgi:hypothetical protein